MSIEPRMHALRCLIAAQEVRGVYGLEHPGVAAAAARCVQALAALHAAGPTVTIALISGGVLIDGVVISERWAISAPLIAQLRQRGVQGIRLAAGVDTADLQWLFDSARGDSSATMSPSRRIIVGQVTTDGDETASSGAATQAASSPRAASSTSQAAPAAGPAALVDPLRESWSAVLSRAGAPPDVSLATLASRIIAATVQNRQSIIPLLDLKAYDEYTFVHVTNVAILASALGEAIGISGPALQQVTEAALLHDVGKWTIPKRILSKPGQLDEREKALMRQHPVIGASLLAGAAGVSDLAIVTAFEHHLRIDGKGYPDFGGIRRPSIPSQIVQVADIFDALRSNRPYRPGMPLEQCLAIMDKEAGAAFDRDLFKVFCERLVRRVPADAMGAAAQRPKLDAAA